MVTVLKAGDANKLVELPVAATVLAYTRESSTGNGMIGMHSIASIIFSPCLKLSSHRRRGQAPIPDISISSNGHVSNTNHFTQNQMRIPVDTTVRSRNEFLLVFFRSSRRYGSCHQKPHRSEEYVSNYVLFGRRAHRRTAGIPHYSSGTGRVRGG